MPATFTRGPRGPGATTIRLRMDLVDARLEELGHLTTVAKAAALDAERSAIYRWRRGRSLTLDKAERVAAVLSMPLEQIITRGEAA